MKFELYEVQDGLRKLAEVHGLLEVPDVETGSVRFTNLAVSVGFGNIEQITVEIEGVKHGCTSLKEAAEYLAKLST
jgi:hypothetical protein